MDTFLLAVGWWNFAGSLFMLSFFKESFGKMVLNDSTKIFATEFTLDYWSKFWLAWAIGLNIFYGLINIYSVKWGYEDVKLFIICSDLVAYLTFMILAIWGLIAKRCGSGIYSVFAVFGFWLVWGFWSLYKT